MQYVAGGRPKKTWESMIEESGARKKGIIIAVRYTDNKNIPSLHYSGTEPYFEIHFINPEDPKFTDLKQFDAIKKYLQST